MALLLATVPVAFAVATFFASVSFSRPHEGGFTVVVALAWLAALATVGSMWRARRAVACYAVAAPIAVVFVYAWLWSVREGSQNILLDMNWSALVVVLLVPLEAASLLYLGGMLAAWLVNRRRRGSGAEKAGQPE